MNIQENISAIAQGHSRPGPVPQPPLGPQYEVR
jgi:hypothetical protein